MPAAVSNKLPLPVSNKRRSTRCGRLAIALLTSTALMVTPLMAAENLPTGAQVASGSVSIGTSGTGVTITQGSDKAIVNWNNFSVGAGNTVNFLQPDTSSAILNRVTGSTSSTIAGSITANGQVYLINPNGIAITSTGTIDVGGGFVASTLDISNDDFLNGNYNFTGNGASGQVRNEGIITIGRGGYAALIGGTVRNDGLIAVPVGKVGLGSGEQATLDLSGDGFLQVAIPTKEGAEGSGALIENNGTIKADGGTIVMTAATVRNAARHAVNLTGVVEANSISGRDGEIVIGGGEGGGISFSGKVKATSATGKGGKVAVTGKSVSMKGATVDASGKTGGGTVKIGGDYQGKGDTQRAETVSIDAASSISADATNAGNGGTVIVWSDELTTFAGRITARGAGPSGIGGDVEVSGKAVLAYTGFTDLKGPGAFGTLLLDPHDITISDGEASNSSGTTATGEKSVISVSTLEAALANANVEISTGGSGSSGGQTGNITFASNIAWSADTVLTLSAYNNIYINAEVKATGATAGLFLNYGGYATESSVVSGTNYSFGHGASVTLSGVGASFAVNGDAYTLIHSMSELVAINSTGLNKNYALGGSIDASGTTYNSALVGRGSSDLAFKGTFAGLGNTVSNLTISNNAASGSYYGMFGYVSGAKIRDLGLVNNSLEISGTSTAYAGGLVGYATSSTLITNAYATGDVTISSGVTNAYSYAGGLAGGVSGSVTISNAYATGNITTISTRRDSKGFAGGLVGDVSYATVSNAYATGAVKVSSGDANGYGYAGGLAGNISNTMVSNVYATGSARASSSSIYSYSYAGGLIGYANSSTISNAFATGNLTTSAGYNGSMSIMGGLVGQSYGSTITNTYATGAGTYTSNYTVINGGLIGVGMSTTIEASYFNTDTSGRTNGVGNDTTLTGATGLTTAELQNTEYFMQLASSWDFENTWAPSSIGYNPELYALSAVVWINGTTTSSTYGDSTATVTTSARGGPSANVFASAGDSLGFSSVTINVDPIAAAGSSTKKLTTETTTKVSADGTVYRIFYYGSDTTTVNKAKLIATAENDTKTYDGLAYSSNNGVTYNGFVNNEDATVLGGVVSYAGTAQGAVKSGTYSIAVSGLTANNYDITYVDGELTVNKKALTVTANSDTKIYDGASYSGGNDVIYGGFVEGEGKVVLDGTLSYSGASQGATDAGTYALSASGLTSKNYEITYIDGTLTINPKAITVTANSTSKTYGDSVLLSYTADGLIGDDALSGSLASGGEGKSAGAGSYTITQGTLANSNYDISFTDGTLTVGKKVLTVTANDDSKTYDGNSYVGGNGVTYAGFVNGEDEDRLGGTLSYLGTSQDVVDAGTYVILARGLTSGNYAIEYLGGTLAVNKKAITVTADSISKNYGVVADLTYTVDGLIDRDVLSGSLASDGSVASANVGNYAIRQATLANSNYDISYNSAELTVTPAILTITANDARKTYDGKAYSGGNGVTYSGFVNGEDVLVLSGALHYGGTAQSAVEAGLYTITVDGYGAENYLINYRAGTLTVGYTPVATYVPRPGTTFQAITQQTLVPVSFAQLVQYSANSAAGNDTAMTTENLQFSNAVCFLAPNFATSCSSN